MKRLVAKPGRFRVAELTLYICSTDVADVADHLIAAFLYYFGEKTGVELFIPTRMTRHNNVLDDGVKPESSHKASVEHISNNGRFPVHSAVKINSLYILHNKKIR